MITRLNAEQAKKRQDDATSGGSRRQGKAWGQESGAETSYYYLESSSSCSASCLGVSSALRIASYPSGGFFLFYFNFYFNFNFILCFIYGRKQEDGWSNGICIFALVVLCILPPLEKDEELCAYI